MKLSCDDLDALLPEFMDGSLTPSQEAAAAEHVATCEMCRVEVSSLRGVGELYRAHGRHRLPDEARKRIAEALGLDDPGLDDSGPDDPAP